MYLKKLFSGLQFLLLLFSGFGQQPCMAHSGNEFIEGETGVHQFIECGRLRSCWSAFPHGVWCGSIIDREAPAQVPTGLTRQIVGKVLFADYRGLSARTDPAFWCGNNTVGVTLTACSRLRRSGRVFRHWPHGLDPCWIAGWCAYQKKQDFVDVFRRNACKNRFLNGLHHGFFELEFGSSQGVHVTRSNGRIRLAFRCGRGPESDRR